MHDVDADDDDCGPILVEDGPVEARAQSNPDNQPWRILIVDDDVDAHVVTKFALKHTECRARPLAYLHAYCPADALAAMRTVPDIALVLLKVDSDATGALELVRAIREELANPLVRIVLRAGRSGQHRWQARHRALLLDYDINDVWSGDEITTHQLVSTVIGSLRTYACLADAAAERRALGARLAQFEQMRAAIDAQLPLLLLDRHGRIVDISAALLRLAGNPGAAVRGRMLSSLAQLGPAAPALEQVMAELAAGDAWTGPLTFAHAPPQGGSWAVHAMRGPAGQLTGYVVLGPIGATAD